MNDLVLTDSALRDVSIPAQKRFDLAFGADENDFELTLPLSEAELSVGDCFYFANTEWGGVIDRRTFNFGANRSITYYGRSWHGILAGSVLCPNAGTDYLTYSGDLHAILRTVVARQGLQGIFAVPDTAFGVSASGSFDRYADAYSALVKLFREKGCKLVFRVGTSHMVELSAAKASPIRLDTDQYDLKIAEGRYVNHLVCLGSGELRNRVVVHLYSDARGNVSTTRTFSGVEEIAATYDYNNAEATELREKGTEKLRQMFADACELEVGDNLGLEIGDVVRAASTDSGIEIEATVEKVTVKVTNDTATVSYEVGNLTRRA